MEGGHDYLDNVRIPSVLRGISFIGPATFQFSFDTGQKDASGRTELMKLEPSSDKWVRMADYFLHSFSPSFGRFSSEAVQGRLRCPGVLIGVAFGCFVDFEFDFSKDWSHRDIMACFEVLET